MSLSVSYTSSSNPDFTLSLPQPTPTATAATTDPVEKKQQYLSQLRQSVLSLQEAVNKELTARMEEDNRLAGTSATNSNDKEEENYGEEVGDDEE